MDTGGFNIASYLIEECNIQKNRSGKTAIIFKDQKYTYLQVNKKVNQYANYLASLELTMEQKIGILMKDCPEFLFLFLGAIKAGVVPVLMNSKMVDKEIEYIIKNSRVRYLFTDREDVLGNFTEAKYLKKIISRDDLIQGAENMNEDYETADTTKDDIAFMLYTSGSSGQPKGAVHLQHDMLVCNETYGKYVLNATENDVFYSQSKLPFAYGLGNSLIYSFAMGGTTILNDSEDIYVIEEILREHKPTLFFAVPSVYKALLTIGEHTDLDFNSVRLCISAGEGLPKVIEQKWEKKFEIPVLQGLGSTELLHIAISNTIENHRYGSLGKAVEGYEVCIVDDRNQPVPANTKGELFVAGDSIMQCYWNRHQSTVEVLYGKGMKTGDTCYMDEEGFVWYVGRSNDSFKVNGIWVHASEIEEVIMEDENVSEVAVTGEVSDEQLTDIVSYIVLNNTNYQEVTKNLKTKIKKVLGRQHCPKKFYFVNELAKGSTGKIKRNELNSLAVQECIK